MLTTFTNPATKILHRSKPKLFAEQKMHINVEQKSAVCLLSDVSREQHNLCDNRHPLLFFK